MTLLLSIVGADAQNYRKWDFTQWSFTTIDNLKAEDIIGGIDGAGWSSTEKANGDNPQPDNCYWSYSEDNSVNGVLSANGVAIAETEGLIFNPQYTVKRNLAIAVNYPTTTLGTYAGSQYLWLAGGNAKSASARIVCFTIPKVKVGQKITMVVESHKPTDARGVALYVNDATDDANQIGEAFKPKTQESHAWVNWTVPAGAATNADGTVDILVVNTNGCHIYSIEVGDNPENTGEAPEEIDINVTNFPDENFRHYLLEQDYGKDGVLTEAEIKGITSIIVYKKGISSLKGIEYFTALRILECLYNKLTALDVSKNTELRYLYCYKNNIKGEAMTELINSLPENNSSVDRYFRAIYDLTDETNICTKSQTAAVKVKGWIPQYYDSGWKEYEGSDDEGGEVLPPSPTISFADSNVKALCVQNWDKNGDGELSEAEATAVSDLGEVFKGNTSITFFDELAYFTGLKSIGQNAFVGCTSLTSITIPSSVTSIGPKAFNLLDLTSIIVESGNTVYDSRDNCNAIIKTSTNELIVGCKNTSIPNSVKSIGDSAFYRCNGLTSITIPNSVTKIGANAFQGCCNITSINIPDSVTDIGNSAFDGCTGLIAVNIPNSLTSIQDGVFHNCTSLVSLTIPEGVTMIGKTAFRGCRSLLKINIPSTVTTIGSYAFTQCSSLQRITIPSSVAAIGSNAFALCGMTVVEIGDGVKSIEDGAFSNCINMKTVQIGNGITSIGHSVFVGCSSLSKIVLPSTVTSIGSYAFQGCSSMTTVEIGDGIKSIGEYAFSGCSSLLQITLPKTMASIGKRAFEGCSSLSSITIPEGISSIDEYTFSNCRSLRAISIPEDVISIGFNAFGGCEVLTEIVIPGNVVSIAGSAFSGCSEMNSVSIPKSLTILGPKVFLSCNKLKSVHITDLEAWCKISFPDESSNPLYYAHNLFLNGEELRELVIPDGVTSINNYSFVGCGSITSVTIPDHVTSIGECAFEGCNAVNYLTLPNNLMIIKKNTFRGCTSLQSVTIPASVQYILQEAFANCSSLQEVSVLALTPPLAYDNTFTNYSVTLSVPEASVGSYQTTSPWSNFTTPQTPSGEEPTIEKCDKPTILYANGELTFGCATEGVEFHWSINNGMNTSGNGSKVSFTPKTTVSVYASKDGFKDSDTATLDINGSGGLKGDVNNNGGIDIGDAVTIVNYLVGKTATLSRGTGVTEDMKEPQ